MLEDHAERRQVDAGGDVERSRAGEAVEDELSRRRAKRAGAPDL